jgi:alkylation response protein AidB-like acyl-CoA dehydrogenase
MSDILMIDDPVHRFRPIFATIAADAVARERDRVLPHEAVAMLRDAGFGALRVPRALGGSGISLRTLFSLLTELAEADPNLPQILRAHFAFVEGQLGREETSDRSLWLRHVVDGALFGAAMAERTDGTETTTRIVRSGPEWVLNGTKYYCTGTLYASWIVAVATDGIDRFVLAVPAEAPGVTRIDDWDGFGQRLTGSGTTHFADVRLGEHNIIRRAPLNHLPSDSYLTAYYQLFHLSGMAGIARAVHRDAVAFVRDKTRTFGIPGRSSPRHDPLVQRVVGRLSAIAFAVEALVDKVADQLDRIPPVCADAQVYVAADISAFEAQQTAIDLVLQAATLLFEVGGASAVSSARGLDRHWRNARVLASHNPAAQRERAIGDYRLNGTDPGDVWRNGFDTTPPATAKPDNHHG